MGKRDYYEVLGVSKEATKEEIKKAWLNNKNKRDGKKRLL